MEFRLKKEDFCNLLRWTQGIAERKSPMLILSNLLLEIQAGQIKMTATDLEMVITVEGAVEGKGNGRWVVNAKNLYEIVREAPSSEIRLIGKESHGLEVTSGSAQSRIVGVNPDDFPKLPILEKSEEVSANPDDLREMIEGTSYAVSTDETRYTLNGILFAGVEGAEGKRCLRLVATDGHRLALSERGSETRLEKGILVPRKGIQELKKLLEEGSGDLKVAFDEKAIRFRRGEVSLSVRLIEGEFPQYEQVIPKKLERIVSVGRDTLMGALRRASILANQEGRGVKMTFSTNLMEIQSVNPDLGESREELPAEYKGQKFNVAFNPRYLLDVLNVIEDEKVVLELKDEISPCVVRSEFDRGFLALVMPMRL